MSFKYPTPPPARPSSADSDAVVDDRTTTAAAPVPSANPRTAPESGEPASGSSQQQASSSSWLSSSSGSAAATSAVSAGARSLPHSSTDSPATGLRSEKSLVNGLFGTSSGAAPVLNPSAMRPPRLVAVVGVIAAGTVAA